MNQGTIEVQKLYYMMKLLFALSLANICNIIISIQDNILAMILKANLIFLLKIHRRD